MEKKMEADVAEKQAEEVVIEHQLADTREQSVDDNMIKKVPIIPIDITKTIYYYDKWYNIPGWSFNRIASCKGQEYSEYLWHTNKLVRKDVNMFFYHGPACTVQVLYFDDEWRVSAHEGPKIVLKQKKFKSKEKAFEYAYNFMINNRYD